MAITTVDGMLAGMQPPKFVFKTMAGSASYATSFWAAAGVPGPGAFDTTLNGVALSSSSGLVAGQIPFYDPGSGLNSYLARAAICDPQNSGTAMICDRLWHNGGFTAVTTAQSITSPTWPARDENGATNGDGVLLGLEYSATGAANQPTISVSYTNSAGTSGQIATNLYLYASGCAAGSFIDLTLQAGDVGVRSVQSVTFDLAPTAGTVALVAYRILASVNLTVLGGGVDADALTLGLPQMFNGSVPFLVRTSVSNSATSICGQLIYTQG